MIPNDVKTIIKDDKTMNKTYDMIKHHQIVSKFKYWINKFPSVNFIVRTLISISIIDYVF